MKRVRYLFFSQNQDILNETQSNIIEFPPMQKAMQQPAPAHWRDRFVTRPHPFIVLLIIVLSVASFFTIDIDAFRASSVDDAPQTYPAQVTDIASERAITDADIQFGTTSNIQELTAEVERDGNTTEVAVTNIYNPLAVGDSIYIRPVSVDPSEQRYEIVAVGRSSGLMVLALLFIVLVLFVSGRKGVSAFIGLLISSAVICSFIIPQILGGANPVVVSVVGSTLIMLGTLYVSHGYNKKSIAALIGISSTLLVVGVLAHVFVNGLSFTGNTSEEATFLLSSAKNDINLVGLVIAGIIIAAIGVLDDIAISQASVVSEFFATDPGMRGSVAFQKAMRLGRDHVSAVINTLVLAYAGASLPLILLFVLGNTGADTSSISALLSNEVIAEEIVRTLVATSGLVLAVPVTTVLAIVLHTRNR